MIKQNPSPNPVMEVNGIENSDKKSFGYSPLIFDIDAKNNREKDSLLHR